MKLFEFESAETGQVKPVAREKESNLETLKEALLKYRVEGTVKEWNALREEAKEHYSEEDMNALDASGFIVEWLKKGK
jgi:hypothetical protein